MVASCTLSWLHRCRLLLSPLDVPTSLPHSISSLTRRCPCWSHSGVYHSPKVANQYNLRTHGLYLHDATTSYLPARAHERTWPRWTCVATANPFWPLTIRPSRRVPSSTWSSSQRYLMGYWTEKGPHQASHLGLVPSNTSHLTPCPLTCINLVKCFLI